MTASRVVIDASVMLAAIRARNRRSASCVVIGMAALGELVAIVSAPIVAEYRRKASEPEVREASQVPDPLRFALDLVAVAESVEPVTVRVVKHDPSDDVYLGTALAGRADYLVTFERAHLLPLDPFRGVRVVPPGMFLTLLRSR
jgi:putative PIN family toxin of toxin-antitoxin system